MTAVAQKTAVGAKSFQVAIAAATLVPWPTLLGGHQLGRDWSASRISLAFGVVHVGTTALFYLDPELRPVLRRNHARYVTAPLAIIAACTLAFAFGPRPVVFAALAGAAVWQIHHFTRQNLGCFAFFCKARGVSGPNEAERHIFDLTGWAGMCGVAYTVAPYGDKLPGVGFLAFPGIALLAVAAARVILMDAPPWRRLGLGVAVLFYAPLFALRGSLGVAVAAYGFAHATQYYVMMAQLRKGRTPVARKVYGLGLIAAAVVVGLPLDWAGKIGADSSDRWMLGAYTGIVAVHFIVDAGVWKLRDAEQRAFMKRRFAFL